MLDVVHGVLWVQGQPCPEECTNRSRNGFLLSLHHITEVTLESGGLFEGKHVALVACLYLLTAASDFVHFNFMEFTP